MPVYERGYEPYAGPRTPLSRRWWPLFREEILPFLKKRRFVFLIFLALIPWFYGIALTFLHTQLGDADWARELVGKLPHVDEKLVATLASNGYDLFILFIVAIWVGAGLVARDRKDRTLDVFLGRAVGPLQYLWAKGAALAAFFLIFSLLPTVVLVIFQVGLTGDVGWLFAHSRVLWGTLLYALVGPGVLVLFILALSSLARSPRLVGLAFLGFAFLGPPVCAVMWAITKAKVVFFPALSIELRALAFACLGAAPDHGPQLPLWMPVLFFLLMACASLLVLWARFARRGVLR